MSKVIVRVARKHTVVVFEAQLSVAMIRKLVRTIIEVAQELDVRDIPFESSLRAIPGFTESEVLPPVMNEWVHIDCASHTLMWGSKGEEGW
jgi:hypothetical protein